ncbi:MAG: chitobiase/beta-hexosaminidase C-terminal domain-containing protein, partial [Ignavibacteriae bacterium]|nr:chitobiase/beta-hexosaminidase C-terminal domain-containing protein [Ignavibacteriota bacterium]
ELGHGSDAYYNSIEEVDVRIGDLLNALDSSGLYESTNIIVISDHGGVGHGHGGESMDEIQIPWIIKGPGVMQNKLIEEPVNTFNTASTIAYLFNIKQPEQWIAKPVLGTFTENEKSLENKNSYLPKPKASIKSGIYAEEQLLTLSVDADNSEIYYTLDGSEPNENSVLYSSPIKLGNSKIVKAISISNKIRSEMTTVDYKKVFGVKSATLKSKPSSKYPAEFDGKSLIDGKLGNDDFTHSAWIGYEYDDFEAVLDLGKVQSLNKVSLSCLENKSSWIFLPAQVQLFASNDLNNFNKIGSIESNQIKSPEKRNRTLIEQSFTNTNFRYLKITAKNIQYCPKGHAGEGGKAWLFIDEILVE